MKANLIRKTLIPLQPEPKILSNNRYSYAEGEGNQPLYMHPCIQFMPEEEVDMVQNLPPEQQATPGRYFIKENDEVDVVRLYVAKCPDGTVQNIKQARCEQRPGQDLKAICGQPDPLTGKSKVEMLQHHLKQLQQQGQQPPMQ